MKRKLEESSGVPAAVRANEIIDLIFIEKDKSCAHLTGPTFTHQLFDNENILLTNPTESRIKIFINCQNLSHKVEFTDTFSSQEVEQIELKLAKALPDDFQESTEQRSETGTLPPGECIHKFEVNGDHFEIYLVSFRSDGAAEILNKAERMALWFIEAADSIEFNDDRWEALFIYRVLGSETARSKPLYFFGGYFTLFTFRNPFSGSKLRVCQALVLPHLQSKGLGKEMLLTVYDLAQAREGVVEVTVEDPAVAFQRLRDTVDFSYVKSKLSIPGDLPLMRLDLLSVSTKDAAQLVSKSLKLTMHQAIFAVEAWTFHHVCESLWSAALPMSSDHNMPAAIEESNTFRRFRLDVKKRLLAENPEIKGFTKDHKQNMLEELFETELKRFTAVCKQYFLVR